MEHIKNAILNGDVVIMPTETVYGLLCLESVKYKLFELKHRPDNIFIARAYGCIEDIELLNDNVMYIIKKLLPGPFTVIDTRTGLGIRVPDHDLFRQIVSSISEKLVMTSANLHQQPAAINFTQAKAYFPNLLGVDGGECKYRKGSTLVKVEVRD